MSLTRVQIQTLKAIEANPAGRIGDWADALGKSIHAVHQCCRILERKGYLTKVKLGKRSSHYVLAPKCGTCPHCRRPMLVEALHERESDHRTKTNAAIVQTIVNSPAKAEAIAKRFNIDVSWVRRLRARHRKQQANACQERAA